MSVRRLKQRIVKELRDHLAGKPVDHVILEGRIEDLGTGAPQDLVVWLGNEEEAWVMLHFFGIPEEKADQLSDWLYEWMDERDGVEVVGGGE